MLLHYLVKLENPKMSLTADKIQIHKTQKMSLYRCLIMKSVSVTEHVLAVRVLNNVPPVSQLVCSFGFSRQE